MKIIIIEGVKQKLIKKLVIFIYKPATINKSYCLELHVVGKN